MRFILLVLMALLVAYLVEAMFILAARFHRFLTFLEGGLGPPLACLVICSPTPQLKVKVV